MPKIEVEGFGTFEAPAGKKLVLAIEDAGYPILHRCGGHPACTTCRVQILEGDAAPQADAELEALEDPALIEKYRLSCQIRIQGDLKVRVWGRVGAETDEGDLYDEPGDRPED